MRSTTLSVIAGICMMLAATVPSAAQDIQLRALSGTGGVAKAQRWTPVVVDLDSSLPSFQGELVLAFGDAVVRREVALASAGRRQFELYIRSPNPEANARVELRSGASMIAAVDVPLRVLPFDESVTLCVMSAEGTLPDAACDATTTAERLPRSLRGYAAVDEVAWPAGEVRLSNDRRRALEEWRVFRDLETSGDFSLAPTPARPLVRRGMPAQSARSIRFVGTVYVGGLIVMALIAMRRSPRLIAVASVFATVVAIGIAAIYGIGRIGSGRTIHAQQNSVLHQIPGAGSSVLTMSGILEFPADDAYTVRLRLTDGILEPPSSNDGTEAILDSDGLSVIAGTYGLGSRRAFTAEGVLDTQPLAVDETGRKVTVSNRASFTMEDCRFADGFSSSSTGSLAPGASMTAERIGEVWGPFFTCTATSAPVVLTAGDRSVEIYGRTVIALYEPSPVAERAQVND